MNLREYNSPGEKPTSDRQDKKPKQTVHINYNTDNNYTDKLITNYKSSNK